MLIISSGYEKGMSGRQASTLLMVITSTLLCLLDCAMLPLSLQMFVNDVLREFLNIFVFVYLDDILIFSPDMESHVVHVRQLLQKLLENQLYIKAEKCDFHASTISS